jgi:low temperature requirement protein LtrA
MLTGVPTGATPIVPELPFIRTRGEGEQRATFFELFFDLVYVFAVTQLSHHLLADISWSGAAETAFMLVALYWAWNYTTWMTNWFDPDTVPVRLVLVFVMLASLLLAVAIPDGFGGDALLFAFAYAGLQIGRNTFVIAVTRADSSTRIFARSSPGACSRRHCGSRAASSMPKRCAGFCGWVLSVLIWRRRW